jgi:hypothetical protein
LLNKQVIGCENRVYNKNTISHRSVIGRGKGEKDEKDEKDWMIVMKQGG